jgi:hypothetical protein
MGSCFSQEKISCETEGFNYNEHLFVIFYSDDQITVTK